MPSHLFRDEAEVRLDVLRRRRELRAQLGPLRRDPNWTRVEVARAHHQAALGDQHRRAEGHLVRAEQRGGHDIPARLQAAVDAEADAASQAFRDERPLRLGEPQLGAPAFLIDDSGLAPVPPIRSCDVHDVRERLHDTGGDQADAGLGDELDRDVAPGLTCLRSKTSCARSSIE